MILRRDGRDGEYIFHGDAYVDGFMYGEALAGLDLRQAYRSTPSPGLVDVDIW